MRRRHGLMLAVVLGSACAGASTPAAIATSEAPVFINEFHYDNVGQDRNEGIEVAGPAGTDLSNYSLEFYNGYDDRLYNTISLSGELPDQESGYGTQFVSVPGLQNGAPDGIALIGPSGVAETLGYEGSFFAANGTAAGLRFADIGHFEAPSTPVGESLQLRGVGTKAADFTWYGPAAATRGQVNTDQSFSTQPPEESVEEPSAPEKETVPVEEAGAPEKETPPVEGSSPPENELIPVKEVPPAEEESRPPGEEAGVSEEEAGVSEEEASPPADGGYVPVGLSPPEITGTAAVGDELSCSTGTWSNQPTSYLYEWTRSGMPIGVFSSTYTTEPADAGSSLTCTVRASNAMGAAQGTSAPFEIAATQALLRRAVEGPVTDGAQTLVSHTASTATTLCLWRPVVLVSVRRAGGSVLVEGVTQPTYAGDGVTITTTPGHGRPEQTFADAAAVSSDGTFAASLPAPSRASADQIRYVASVSGRGSEPLKLVRRLQVRAVRDAPGGMVARFQLAPRVRSGAITIVEEDSCGEPTRQITKAFSGGRPVTMLLPAKGRHGTTAYYRAVAQVGASRTYSVLIPVAGED